MSSFSAISGIAELDAGGYVDETGDVIDAQDELASSSEATADAMFSVDAAGAAAGAGMAAAGVGAQSAFDNTRDMRESLDRTARQMGITREEAVGLTQGMTDVTLSTGEVSGSMDTFVQLGIDSEQQMESLVLAADNLGDALGEDADIVAQDLAPAVRSYDGDLTALQEDQDVFTAAVRDTALDLNDLTQTMSRARREGLDEMVDGSDEATALIAAFGEQSDLSGSDLRREFAQSVREADGDIDELKDSLDLSEEELQAFQDETVGSTERTDKLGESVEENATLMDEMRVMAGDARLQFADMAGPANAAAVGMQAAGSAALVYSTVNLSTIPTILGKTTAMAGMAATAVGTAVPALTATAAAAAPVALPLIAIAGAGAALYYAFDNDIGGIRTIAEDTFGRVLEIVEDVRDAFPGSIEDAAELAMDAFTTFHPAGILWDRRDEIMDAAGDIRDGLEERVSDAVDRGTEVFLQWHPAGIVYRKRDEIMDALPSASAAYDAATSFVSSFVDGIRDAIPNATGAVDDLTGAVADYLPSSDAAVGPLSNLTARGGAIPETLADGVRENSDDFEASIEEMADDAVRGLSLRDVESQLEDELEAAEDEEEVEALEAQLEEVTEAEAITDVDEELLAGVALELEEEQRREEEHLESVTQLVETELETAAPDPADDIGPSPFEQRRHAPDVDGEPTPEPDGDRDRRTPSLTKDDIQTAVTRALEGTRRTIHLEVPRDLEAFVEETAEETVNDIIGGA